MAREARTCPICRTGNYQKKLTQVGSLAYAGVCALKIQSFYRGYNARKTFRVQLKGYYQRGAGAGSDARKKFFQKELSLIGDLMLKETDARTRGLSKVIKGIDDTLEEGRELDLMFEEMLRLRERSRREAPQAFGDTAEAIATAEDEDEQARRDYEWYGDSVPPARLGAVQPEPGTGLDMQSVSKPVPDAVLLPILSREQWLQVISRAKERGLGDCAICMGSNRGTRHICLLSCSHVFHSQCMVNFEKFVTSQKGRGCPVCRTNFVARGLTTSFELIDMD